MSISKIQQETLNQPCPKCGDKLTTIGDLSDFEHDLVAHAGNDHPCEYVMFADGSTMED